MPCTYGKDTAGYSDVDQLPVETVKHMLLIGDAKVWPWVSGAAAKHFTSACPSNPMAYPFALSA